MEQKTFQCNVVITLIHKSKDLSQNGIKKLQADFPHTVTVLVKCFALPLSSVNDDIVNSDQVEYIKH